MIIKANNKAISISASGEEDLDSMLHTTDLTMPVHFIAKIKVSDSGDGEYIEIVDLERNEYCIFHESVILFNADSSPINSASDLLNKINNSLFGF
jgi:hypothetical protein